MKIDSVLPLGERGKYRDAIEISLSDGKVYPTRRQINQNERPSKRARLVLAVKKCPKKIYGRARDRSGKAGQHGRSARDVVTLRTV